ncbi:MAG: hypothetical protein KC503_33815 [Myxococcales bacterium]|nr:hypothetical protein [Myxococcales bacterium]
MRFLVTAVIVLAVSQAHAGELPCTPVKKGVIQLDGLLGEWHGVTPARASGSAMVVSGRGGWNGDGDLSFTVRCNLTRDTMYIAINVKDDYFVRANKLSASDHARLHFGGRTLYVYPGDLRRSRAVVSWNARGKRRARGVKIAESMQKRGWSVEIALPLRKLPGFRAGSPSMRASVSVADTDHPSAKKPQHVMRAPFSRISFAQQRANLLAFLKDKGFRASQIRFKRNANVVGDRRLEQVLLVGRTIGIVGDGLPGGGYFYLNLPVSSGRDVRWIKLVDLNGDGLQEILVQLVERASNGRRELVAIYRYNDSNQFVRPMQVEVLKAQGSRYIKNRFRMLRRRKRKRGQKRRGYDLWFDKPKAGGFDQSSYREAPASDAFPILLPWGETKKRGFRFEGEEFSQL